MSLTRGNFFSAKGKWRVEMANTYKDNKVSREFYQGLISTKFCPQLLNFVKAPGAFDHLPGVNLVHAPAYFKPWGAGLLDGIPPN